MPKRTKKASGGKGLVALMLVAVLGVAAFAAYVKFDSKAAHVPADLARVSQPDLSIVTHTDKVKATAPVVTESNLLVPALVNNEVKLGHDAGPTPKDIRPEIFLVNQTLNSLMIDKAKAIGVDVKNRVALMDFSPDIEKGYGSQEEGNLIKALQMALGQFPDIDKFQIIVDGKPVDSLGAIDLTDPIPVIRPGQSESTTSEDSNPPTPN